MMTSHDITLCLCVSLQQNFVCCVVDGGLR